MKKKREGLFCELYRFDKNNGAYIIEIALDKYSDIFNEWDPAPFKLRDMDPDLKFYLEGSSDDIPLRYPIELFFTIPKKLRNAQLEDQARKGLRNSLTFERYFIKKDIDQNNSRIALFIIIGFTFLWAAVAFPGRLAESVFPSIIVEGLFIGGWVFIWEAISLIVFANRRLYFRYRTYKRLNSSPVEFRDSQEEFNV